MAATGDDIQALTRACNALIADVRARVAAEEDPDSQTETRIRDLAARARKEHPEQRAAVDQVEQRALKQLERVLSVYRSRALLARPRAQAAAAAPARRPRLRSRPTLTGNMEVRRESSGGRFTLAWDPAKAVTSWEVRFSERENPRGAYLVRETLTLPASETTVALPLSEHAMQVHVLGRGRDGRLLRRAVISALTREGWNERWQRRASAS